jgi:hypothetical protein
VQKDGFLADKGKPAKGHICESCQWETAELPTALVAVRFHDLRHTAVSRMIAARVPRPIIAKIVGWSAGTMAKMAAQYGHFGMEELRGAVEAISSPKIGEGTRNFHRNRMSSMETKKLTNRKEWSGRLDSNQRPPAPKAGALPGCATPRLMHGRRYRTFKS